MPSLSSGTVSIRRLSRRASLATLLLPIALPAERAVSRRPLLIASWVPRVALAGLLWLAGASGPIRADEQAAGQLVLLARAEFPDLTTVEAQVCRAIGQGLAFDPLASRDQGEPGEAAATGGAEIRARVLAWLVQEPRVASLLSRRGVTLRNTTFTGVFDLQYGRVAVPLRFEACTLADGLDLHNAELFEFHLTGSRIGFFFGDQLRVQRDLSLTDGFIATGEVRVPFGWIEGNLDLTGATLQSRQADALFAEGCRVDGDVRLRYGFRAERRVSLQGARIAGTLDAEAAEFAALSTVALELSGGRIVGDCGFQQATVTGGLACHGLDVRGDCNFDGCQLLAPHGSAIRGYAVEVGGDLRFVGATICGDVLLEGAEIGRDLNLADVTFTAADGPVEVNFHAVTATRRLRWTGVTGCQAAGVHLDLRSAHAGTLLDDVASWPEAGHLRLHGFDYSEIHDDAPFDAASRIAWLRRQSTARFRAQPYEQLAEIFQKGGQAASAREVLIAKEADRARLTNLNRSEWFWYHVFGPIIGFGYEPWRALWLMTVVILAGAAIFQTGYWAGWMTPTKVVEHVFETDVEPRLSPEYPKFNAVVYSLDVFTPLTYLHQADYWMPNPLQGPRLPLLRIPAGDLLRMYMWLHVVAGWTLTSLLIAGLSGLVEHH